MPVLIETPTQIKACGDIPKVIKEYIGLVNSKTSEISMAHMQSPAGWTEPGQTPQFNEYTLVLKGELDVEFKDVKYNLKAGQAVIAKADEWVRYSTPKEGAEYIAVCLPAFSPETVCRDQSAH